FVVVLTVNNIDIVVLFQQGFHNFLSFCLCKFAALLSQKIPSVFLNAFFQSLCTSDLSCRSDCSLNIYNIKLACIPSFCSCVCIEPFCCFPSFAECIGSDPCCI